MIRGPIEVTTPTGITRRVPFIVEKHDLGIGSILVDTTFHRYKVVYAESDSIRHIRVNNFWFLSDLKRAIREAEENYGARVETL